MFMRLPEKQEEEDEEDQEQEEFWIDDEKIDLTRHIGSFYTTLPAFGYPTMNFHEDPQERVASGLRTVTSFDEADAVRQEVTQYVHNKHHRNWKKFLESASKAMPCRGQLYQKHKYERAFEIIEKSFTFGAKLKRNPICEHERARNRDKVRLEKCRFDVYRRAWMYKHHKSQSLASLMPGDKSVFSLDWGKPPAEKAGAGKKRKPGRQRTAQNVSLG